MAAFVGKSRSKPALDDPSLPLIERLGYDHGLNSFRPELRKSEHAFRQLLIFRRNSKSLFDKAIDFMG